MIDAFESLKNGKDILLVTKEGFKFSLSGYESIWNLHSLSVKDIFEGKWYIKGN